MVIPSLHKLMLGSCQGATCCELGVTRGGLGPRGVRPANAPRNFNRGCAVCWGDNYKGNGRLDLAERERTRGGVNELENAVLRDLLLQIMIHIRDPYF